MTQVLPAAYEARERAKITREKKMHAMVNTPLFEEAKEEILEAIKQGKNVVKFYGEESGKKAREEFEILGQLLRKTYGYNTKLSADLGRPSLLVSWGEYEGIQFV